MWNLENLRQAIAAEISHLQALENCQFTSDNKSYNSNVSSFNTNVKSYRKSCLFCSKGHETYKCAEFNTTEKRLNQCKVMKLCFNCLRRNHAVAQCKNPVKCRNCGLEHHSTL